jgi:hypothetical protein
MGEGVPTNPKKGFTLELKAAAIRKERKNVQACLPALR